MKNSTKKINDSQLFAMRETIYKALFKDTRDIINNISLANGKNKIIYSLHTGQIVLQPPTHWELIPQY